MAASLVTTLPNQDNLIFAGNIPDLTFSGVSPEDGLEFKLLFDIATATEQTLLDEIIFPDANGQATVKIRAVVEASLIHSLPDADMFVQTTACRKLVISYDGSFYSLYVIKGGLMIPESDYNTFDYNTFALTNLLSWMPAERRVKYREPLYVNFFNASLISGTQLYARAYYINESNAVTSQEYALYSAMTYFKLYSFNTAFNVLMVQTSETHNIIAFEVYVKQSGSRITNIQRFVLINDFDEYDDVFAFSNSLGGFETIRFNGLMVENENHKPIVFRDHNNKFIEFETTHERIFQKFTGYFDTDNHRKWVKEFFTSAFRFHLRPTENTFEPERITITGQTAPASRFVINANSFEFKYANQVPWQLNVRDTLMPVNHDDAVATQSIGDLPDSEFDNDFLNQTPLNQLTDELLNT